MVPRTSSPLDPAQSALPSSSEKRSNSPLTALERMLPKWSRKPVRVMLSCSRTPVYKEETKNEAEFVEKFAAPFDLFVNDAFGTAHRAHASTEGVTKFLSPSVSGYLLAKELEYL